MSIGAVIEEICQTKGLTQKELGSIGNISPKTVSAIKTGRRNAAKDVLYSWAEKLDSPRVYLEMVREVGGGVYGTRWLDGENVDLHRTSVFMKTSEELKEALEALESMEKYIINHPNRIGEDEKVQIKEALLQCLDARVAIDTLVAVKCDTYGLSVRSLFYEHQHKLKQRGYIKKETRR